MKDMFESAYCEKLDTRAAPRTCLDHLCLDRRLSGLYEISPVKVEKAANTETCTLPYRLPVYCDQDSAGGGWTVSYNKTKHLMLCYIMLYYMTVILFITTFLVLLYHKRI